MIMHDSSKITLAFVTHNYGSVYTLVIVNYCYIIIVTKQCFIEKVIQ